MKSSSFPKNFPSLISWKSECIGHCGGCNGANWITASSATHDACQAYYGYSAFFCVNDDNCCNDVNLGGLSTLIGSFSCLGGLGRRGLTLSGGVVDGKTQEQEEEQSEDVENDQDDEDDDEDEEEE